MSANFDSAIDEFFDEMLLERWNCAPSTRGVVVLERSDRYEVRLECPGVDPARISVEVVGRRLTVRAGATRTLEFAHALDADRVTARWSAQTLVVVLPRRQALKVPVKTSGERDER